MTGLTLTDPAFLGAASGTFSPLSLSPALWLDASDAATITSSGGLVSQWNDKSGNGYHVAQSTSTNQPKTGTRTINGRNALEFDGSNDLLLRSAALNIARNTTAVTVYFVAAFDLLPTTERIALIVRNGTNGNARISCGAGATSGKGTFAGRTLDGDNLARVNSTNDVSTTTAQAFIGLYDYANTDLFIYVNNVLEGTNSAYQTANATSNTDSIGMTVGATLAAALPFDGSICEILIYNTGHTAAQRAQVYGYLAAKWGL